nr:probable ADP-ribosylation factor GTPase-activating protein AGD9 [Tanacetum cinerariifolium]
MPSFYLTQGASITISAAPRCALIEFIMITITLNEDLRFHYMDSSEMLETSSGNVNTLSYVTPHIPKSSSFFADYGMDNANLKPKDGEEPLEIRLIRKWISYGKRGECCFIFIGQNGDAIQSVATLSVKSYFDSLFKEAISALPWCIV